MGHGGRLSPLAYDLSLGILSVAILALIVILFIVCKKRSIQPEDVLPIKLSARSYSLADVDAATDGFSRRQVLGTGPHGTVYQAILASGDLVAVKRVHSHLVLGNAGSSFSSTIKSLSWAHHPHIVPVVGFSEGPGERIILTELMGLRSLEFHLHQSPESGTAFLDWPRRIRIAGEAARGIEYLHEVAMPRLVHGCIKPSNILIDLNFRARVCDYGLTFLAPQERRGVEAYVDGEYWEEKDGGVCMASDVYGFGIVLLELLSGRRSETNGGLLVEWALHLIRESRVEELLDPRLRVPYDMTPLMRMSKVALACVGNSRKSRPSIGQVAAILNSLVTVDDQSRM
ncbi:serine/threonine-protein kinase-like protein CR4 [Aristolochia californica]|uniref:serine/threonine-protein kinase-like protein CR4 n=1 Tax=Aristolochia californica TaxID=171875 RepID=UPI0035D8F61A